MKKVYKIKGMHCNSCATLIEKEFKDSVNSVSASFKDEKAEIDFDESKISEKEIMERIEKLGYECKNCEIDNPEQDKESKESLIKQREELKEMFLGNELSSAQYEKLKKAVEAKIAHFDEEEKKKEDKEEAEKEEKKEVQNNSKKDKGDKSAFGWLFLIFGVLLFLFVIYKVTGFQIPELKLPEIGDNTSLILLFLVGILTGFHCISMCGGFVVSYTAKNAINGHKSFKQHLVYGGSKVISYTIIGGIFGLIGGLFAFSIGLRGWVAIIAGLFMISYSLSMMGIKFFRRFQFNPKFLTKAASKAGSSAKGPYKAPMVTGLLNGLFIACGPLQAMYLFAAGTGNWFSGATSLAAFGLGTLPIMLGFGSLATVISHKTTAKILKVSAVIVLILGLIMLNRGLALTGSSWSYDSIKAKIIGGDISNAGTSVITGDTQEVNMDVDASGYSPNSFVIKKGVPVKWNVQVSQLTGCNSELVMRDYSVDVRLKKGLNVIEFTPTKTGTVTFTCGMGMLRGSFIVTETGTASQQEISAATPAKGSSCGMGAGCGCGG